jgi:DNA excision repair protein ERCC-4
VYRSSNPGLGVRVYHMVYKNSCEEHKLLASMRREKDSFERLIKERGVRCFTRLSFLRDLQLNTIVDATSDFGR